MASDPLQLTIPKGIVSWTPIVNGVKGTKRDLGEVSAFSSQLNVTRTDFFSSRSGVRKKVRSVVTEKSITLSMTMNEWTEENLGMALFGTVTADSVGGGSSIDIFSENEITGELEIDGQNDVGAKVKAVFYNVSFTPNDAMDFIGDDWAGLSLTGEALIAPDAHENAGSFGKADVTPGE